MERNCYMKIHSTAGLLAACTLAAAAPAPFAVLDMEHAKTRAVRTVIQDADYFCNLPQETKKSKTFLIGEWDYNTMRPHVNLKSENPFPLQKLAMVVSKGDYGFKGFLLRAYAPLTNLSVKTGELRSDGGNVIAQENILAARVAESIDYPAADILMPPEMKKVPDKALLGFAILVNIPGTAVPGVYHTTITVTADGQSRQLPLSVRVPNFTLPEADIPIGSYLVYYASDQGGREGRWAGEDYKAARQGKYFHFLATRGMNSSSIFHYCPEFTSGDSAEIKFDTLDSLMEKIVAGGSCKAMTFDLRYLIGNAARLAKLKKFQDAGKDDVAIYKDMVRQFCEHAKKKNYPRFYVMAEEEIANGGIKQKNYDRYGKAMQEAAGSDLSMILDNSVGAGKVNAVDRGHRDGYRFRQYNSWTDEAIAQAEKDGAEVWSYNYSYKRPSFGLLLHRLNSRCHHQWADTWGKAYTISIPADNGVVSSLKYEMAHEGITDYRWLMALKKKNDALRRDMVKEIPVDNAGANAYAANLPVSRNDLIRWRAILELTGDTNSGRTAPGTPQLKITGNTNTSDVQTKDMVIHALQMPDSYEPDAKLKGWAHKTVNATKALRYMLAHERRLRAITSSEEEFRKKNAPSYSEVWVNYNNRGILLTASVNHTPYGKGNYKDDDPSLWKDNCMEFFFRTPEKIPYQLIVNAADAKVMLKAGKVLDSTGIRISGQAKKGGAGGYIQEIFVPWSVFGLHGKPENGTIWAFNAGREFHSWGQNTCWARVEGSFGDSSRWGALKFSGQKQLVHLKNIKLERLYPGSNIIAGAIPGKEVLKVVLRDPAGKTIAEKMLHAEDRRFHFGFRLLPEKSSKAYTLEVLDAQGKTLEAESIPVIPAEQTVEFKSPVLECASGDIVSTIAELNVSPLEIRNHGITFRLRDRDGKVKHDFKADPAGKQSFRIWLKTSGLTPGEYTLTPELSGDAKGIFPNAGGMKIRIYPAII